MRKFINLRVEKLTGRNGSYERAIHQFKTKARSRARLCKALKEHAVVIQEFDLAAALRDAEKSFLKISGGAQ